MFLPPGKCSHWKDQKRRGTVPLHSSQYRTALVTANQAMTCAWRYSLNLNRPPVGKMQSNATTSTEDFLRERCFNSTRKCSNLCSHKDCKIMQKQNTCFETHSRMLIYLTFSCAAINCSLKSLVYCLRPFGSEVMRLKQCTRSHNINITCC